MHGAAFVAVGELAVAVREEIVPSLDAILTSVKDSLAPRGYARRPGTQFATERLCLHMLTVPCTRAHGGPGGGVRGQARPRVDGGGARVPMHLNACALCGPGVDKARPFGTWDSPWATAADA